MRSTAFAAIVKFAVAVCLVLSWVGSAQAAVSFVSSSSTASGNTSVSITAPASTALNDLLIAQISFRSGSSVTVTPPAGWTLLRRDNNGTTLGQALYYKWVTASEPASYSWGLSPGDRSAGLILAYRGVDTTSPFNAQGGQANPNSSSVTAPSITTTVANAQIVGFFSVANGNATFTAPSGMTNRVSTGTGAGPNGVTIHAAGVAQAAAGATGTKVASSTSPNLNIGQLVALTPIVAGSITPGAFNAFETSTAAGSTTGVIKTKIAGSPIQIDIVALNGAKTAVLTTFTGTVKLELLNASNQTGALDANNCRSSWTVIQTLSNATFSSSDNGRKTIFFQENGAWRDARVRITFPATGTATAIGCSTDDFAVRPSKLSSVSVKDLNWTTAGTARSLNNVSASGGTVHRAGQPFTLSATAINALASPTVTTGYDGSPVANLTACLLPTGCSTTALGTFDPGTWSNASGVATSTTATYSEVGAFTLQLEDQDFAGVDEADSSTAERYFSSDPLNVGRFVPDYFDISVNNTPQLKTFDTLSSTCASRSFTYIGQPFGYLTAPQILVTARNAAGDTTANYSGDLWKLTTPASSTTSCTTSPDQCIGTAGNITQTYTYTLTPASTPNWDSTQVVMGVPSVLALNNGTGLITSNVSDKLAFLRSTTAAQSTFTANISLSYSVSDATEASGTGVASCAGSPSPCSISPSASAVFNGASSGGIDFDAGNEFRYGLMQMYPGYGSDLLALPMSAEIQYWNGSAFASNTADNCTTIQSADITVSPNTCTSITGTTLAFTAGKAIYLLQKSNASCQAAITANLDAAGENKRYLQGPWSGATFVYNPQTRANFGLNKNGAPIIYLREIY